MPIALNQLPDDIDALKSLVADQAVRNEQLQSKVILLQEHCYRHRCKSRAGRVRQRHGRPGSLH